MSSYTWLIIAAVLLATELASGTFYLLMLAIAAAAAWFAQLLGTSFLTQALIFLIASAVLVTWVHLYRKQTKDTTPNPTDDILDAGEIITVTDWHNGIGHTHYRGSAWQVVLQAHNEQPQAGEYRIVRFEGTRLMVTPL